MTHTITPGERMEAARASLRTHVIPRLNEKGRSALALFLENPVLEAGQTLDDVALDITAGENITRPFKEGEVLALAALLESFANNEQQYLQIQAASPKAQHVQEHIDALDGALFAGGADYTKLGQLIGGMRTLVSSPEKPDVISWFLDNAAKLGVDLHPDATTSHAVETALGKIQDVLNAPSMAEKYGTRPKRVLEVG